MSCLRWDLNPRLLSSQACTVKLLFLSCFGAIGVDSHSCLCLQSLQGLEILGRLSLSFILFQLLVNLFMLSIRHCGSGQLQLSNLFMQIHTHTHTHHMYPYCLHIKLCRLCVCVCVCVYLKLLCKVFFSFFLSFYLSPQPPHLSSD